jgi:putative phosphoribosyl transferase
MSKIGFSSPNESVNLVAFYKCQLILTTVAIRDRQIDTFARRYRFHISLLACRLEAAVRLAADNDRTNHLTIGLFGASVSAGAALIAAATLPDLLHAVVSRGGRPDLAGALLERVTAPTLLIVGSRDPLVIDLNSKTLNRMPGHAVLEIVPYATHLFEEPGALAEVARLANDWFTRYLPENE